METLREWGRLVPDESVSYWFYADDTTIRVTLFRDGHTPRKLCLRGDAARELDDALRRCRTPRDQVLLVKRRMEEATHG